MTIVHTANRTIRIGLIGAGIQPSRTPQLHEAEAQAAGLSCTYQLIDMELLGVGVEALPRLLEKAQKEGFAGVNITYPCKLAVVPLLDELSDDAAAIGAVNTVVFAGGKRIGHNTDGWGFAENFKRGMNGVAVNRVVMLGAGGAGYAIAHAALMLGAGRLAIYDLVSSRALALSQQLVERFGAGRAVCATDLREEMAMADGLIQATPVGMVTHPGLPLPIEWLRPTQWVSEIVYFPLETELLRQARALGCCTLDGGGMAVFQAVEAFRLFTGITADRERMLNHFARM
jgi:quinate/shikimate dehydrogenase (NAD+)